MLPPQNSNGPRSTDAHSGGILRYFLGSAFWCVLGGAFYRLAGLVTVILVSRLLGKQAVGWVALVQTTILVAGAFAGVGLGMAATRIVAENLHKNQRMVGASIRLLSTTLLVVLFATAASLTIGASWFAEHIIGEADVAPLFEVAGPLLIFTGLQHFQNGVLAGMSAFRKIALANGLASLLGLPVIVLAVSLGDLTSAIWGLTGAAAIGCLISRWFVRRELEQYDIRLPSWRASWERRDLIWRFGLPCLMLSMINAPIDWIAFRLLIGASNGAAELGIYAAANQWCLLIRFIPMTLGAAILPLAAIQTDNHAAWRRVVMLSFAVNAMISVPLCLLVAGLSPWIMSWYGVDFTHRWLVLAILAFGGVCISMQLTAERILVSSNGGWIATLLNVVWGAMFCTGVAMTIGFGAEGMAVSRLATWFGNAVVAVCIVGLIARRRGEKQTRIFETNQSDLHRPEIINKAA